MEILAILESMEDVVEKSAGLPFSTKCIVDREEMLEIVCELKLKLPDEIKQAKWIKDERKRILFEAEQEGKGIVDNADAKIAAMVDQHEITRKAYEQANEIISNAQKNAREIRLGTKEYADDVLADVEDILAKTISTIKENRTELK